MADTVITVALGSGAQLSEAELYEREDYVVPSLDLRDISGKEVEEREAEVC